MELVKFTLLFFKQRINSVWLILLIISSLLIYKITNIKPEIIAIIISPLFTLSILSILEEYKAKWNSRYDTFKVLYANRGNLINYDVVRHLNIIDIIFIDDMKVREAWKELFCELKRIPLDDNTRRAKLIELLNAMAQSLGLNKNIEFSDIADTYYPTGLGELDEQYKLKTNLEIDYYKKGSDFFNSQMYLTNAAIQQSNKQLLITPPEDL